jgi:DNA-binding FadR family transcriptional regulator
MRYEQRTTMKTGTLPRRKIRDEVAQRIKELIAAERLGRGDRLPTEGELAAHFGVSRLSVREATKALEFLGIVEAKTGVGLAVGQIDLARVADHLGFHPALHRADPEQLIDSRVILETGVLGRVAQRMARDRSIGDALQGIIEEFRSANSIQTWIELDIRFHRTLLEASGLAPMVAFGDLLQVFFQRFRDSVKRAEWKAAIQSHQRILDRLRAGDVAGAEAELRTHIESHRQRLGAAR